MTTKAITKAPGALTIVSKGLQAKKGELVQSPDFLAAVALAGQLQAELDEFWGSVQTFMEVNKVKGSKGDWGHITLAERRTLGGNVKDIKPRFLKQAIATDQVRAYATQHGGKLPAGITEKTSKYLSKKVKS